ncbi:MAG: hypothetical protein R6V75_00130 [Bacteroidales bacterium]
MKSRKLYHLTTLSLLVLALLIPVIAPGQTVRATATLDTTRMLIGDQVNLWLTLEQPAGLAVRFPLVVDSLDGKIEVLSISGIDTVGRRGEVINLRQRFLLTAFDTGFFVIPSLAFRLEQQGDVFATRALPLEVLGIPIDTTKGIIDIKPPYELPITLAEVLPYLLIGLLAATILFFYLRYLKKRREKPEIQQESHLPPVPAHIWALEQMDTLVKEKLWQQGKIKLFYSRLTDIIRRYIEMRYKVPAMEQTTDEIIGAIARQAVVTGPVRKELQELLELADLVKFAKWHPVAEEHEQAQQAAYDFILRTKPVVNLRKPVGEVTSKQEEEAVQ